MTAATQISNIPKPEKPLTRILFVFDASTSMLERWEGKEKFEKAKELFFELLDSLEKVQQTQKLEVALRVYGHQSPAAQSNCLDTKLEVSFGNSTIGLIRDKMKSITPKGTTPIAYSLLQTEYDFPETNEECRNIIILITDGIEMCQGDPCGVSIALQKRGVTLKPYIIGVDIDNRYTDFLKCMGNYFNAANEKDFRQAINTIVTQVTNLTAVKVYLLNANGLPLETNVSLSFNDNLSGDLRYTYEHTLDVNNRPDTIYLDILSIYDMTVHTIPPVYKDSIKLDEGKLNIIEVHAPQGTLFVNIKGDTKDYSNIKCLLRKSALPQTIYVLDADKKQKLITGLYDLEVLTMPRLYFNAIKIEQSKVYKIDIPEPGDVVINFKNPAYGTLLYENGDVLTNIFDFTPDKQHHRFNLQPGYYRIIYREQKHKKAVNTSEAKFRVQSGQLIIHNL